MIIYNFFRYLVMYIQYMRVLRQVYTEEKIIDKFSQSFGSEFRIDWVGRLYTIFNPNLRNGEFDVNNPIYSYNEKGLNTDEFVKQYIMTKLNAIDMFIRDLHLFELVSYDLKKLYNFDKYLFVIKPLPIDKLIHYTKLMIIPITIIIGLLIGYLVWL